MITSQKMKFSIKDVLSKCDQIRKKLWIWSHLLKKSLMENFIFCAVDVLIEYSDMKEAIKNPKGIIVIIYKYCFNGVVLQNIMNEVILSSIVKWAIKTILNLFAFFLRQRFHAHKNTYKRKSANKTKIS